MGFLDKFQVEWNSKDETRRKKAIEKILTDNNQKEILKVASKAKYEDVLKKLIDNTEDIYAGEVAKQIKGISKRWKAKLYAIQKIKDEQILADIIAHTSGYVHNEYVGYAAVKKINNESILIDLALNNPNPDVRIVAVEKINDESVLLDVINKDPVKFVRIAAIQKINNTSVLENIVQDDYQISHVRSEAALRVNNESILKKVAKYGNDVFLRFTITKIINDEELLKEFAENDEYWDIRKEAVIKINDVEFLKDIVKNDENDMVKVGAIDKIIFLMNTMKNDETQIATLAAISNANEKKILKELANSDNKIVRDYIHLKNIKNQNDFITFYNNAHDSFIRELTLYLINDEKFLKYIAKKHPNSKFRSIAISKIKDQSFLEDIFEKEVDSDVLFNIGINLNNESIIAKRIMELFGGSSDNALTLGEFTQIFINFTNLISNESILINMIDEEEKKKFMRNDDVISVIVNKLINNNVIIYLKEF